MQNIHYIKPFSNGQITIPKKFRDELGLDKDTWLRVELKKESISIKPEAKEKKYDKKAVLKKLESVDGSWFNYKEWQADNKKMRQEIEDRLKQYDL